MTHTMCHKDRAQNTQRQKSQSVLGKVKQNTQITNVYPNYRHHLERQQLECFVELGEETLHSPQPRLP